MSQLSIQAARIRLVLLLILLLATTLGCSLGRILLGDPTPTPTPVPPTPLPTWTPTPEGRLSPAQAATLTVIAALNWPTLTPTPTAISTPAPTWTPLPPLSATPIPPTPTPAPPTPTLTPTPYVRVEGSVVNVREGPSIAYPIIGQVRQGDLLTLIGRNELGTWWQVCCVGGREGWISAQLVSPQGATGQIAVVPAPNLPPPTNTPVPTPTPRPYRPFDIGDGPQFFASSNPWLTIWVKTFGGHEPDFYPIPGYRLRVLRNGVDVSKQDTTKNVFELSAPLIPEHPEAYGNRRQYNLKYEYMPEAGDAQWKIYLMDANGVQVSPEVTFETERNGLLREVYVGFYDTRTR